MKCNVRMKRAGLIVGAAVLLTLSGASTARGQTVMLVRGSVFEPPSLKRGDKLRTGQRITLRDQALVLLEYNWQSDVADFPCTAWIDIRQSTTVPDPRTIATPGKCAVVSPQGSDWPNIHGPIRFYGEPKADAPPPPERVTASLEEGRRLWRDLSRVPNSFTGVLRSVEADAIKLSSIGLSGPQRRFSFTPNTIVEGGSLEDWKDKQVLVDYTADEKGLWKAVKIRLVTLQ